MNIPFNHPAPLNDGTSETLSTTHGRLKPFVTRERACFNATFKPKITRPLIFTTARCPGGRGFEEMRRISARVTLISPSRRAQATSIIVRTLVPFTDIPAKGQGTRGYSLPPHSAQHRVIYGNNSRLPFQTMYRHLEPSTAQHARN